MYYITRTNRGKQVIERRNLPDTNRNTVRMILKNVFGQDTMLCVITGIMGATFIIKYLT